MHFRSIMTRRQLTVDQRVFIIKRYFSTGSYKNIQEEWSNSFSAATPTKSTMFALINKFNTTGSTADAPRSGRPIPVTTEENRQLVQGAFSASPKKSARRASIELEISDRSIRRMLQALDMNICRFEVSIHLKISLGSVTSAAPCIYILMMCLNCTCTETSALHLKNLFFT